MLVPLFSQLVMLFPKKIIFYHTRYIIAQFSYITGYTSIRSFALVMSLLSFVALCKALLFKVGYPVCWQHLSSLFQHLGGIAGSESLDYILWDFITILLAVHIIFF